MNPWEMGIMVLGWIFFAACVLGGLILVFGVVFGIAKFFGASWAMDDDEHGLP